MATPLLAEVAPAVPLPVTSPQTYSYRVPTDEASSLTLYQYVRIPFGRRTVAGTVMDLSRRSVRYRTKPIERIHKQRLLPEQIAFGQWLATTMQGGLGYTLRLFVPTAVTDVPREQSAVSPSAPQSVVRQALRTLRRRPIAVIERDLDARAQLLASLSQAVIAQGKKVLILVPEKHLLMLLVARLEQANVSPLLSVTAETRVSAMRGIADQVAGGEPAVVVGTQKSLFLPFHQLGLVVVEEEWYPTYKLWDQYPRLHTVLGAERIATLHQAGLVYSGSIPSVRLHQEIAVERVAAIREKPVILRTKLVTPTPLDRQQHHLLPAELTTSLRHWLKEKRRVVILHNRTGTWQIMQCRTCQAVVRCPECEAALRVHGTRQRQTLVCHQCGYTGSVPEKCPACTKGALRVFGPGSERLETLLRPLLPARADFVIVTADQAVADISTPKHGQLILGTSALFRYLPAGSVDRAIFLFPEQGLLYPDYRSEEKSWYTLARLQQLLPTTVPVWLVSRQPRVVAATLTQAPERWYTAQLSERRRLSYPPFTTMVRLTVAAAKAGEAIERAHLIRQQLAHRAATQKIEGVLLRGPFESYVKRRRGKAEAHLLLLGELEALTKLYAGVAAAVDVMPERIL